MGQTANFSPLISFAESPLDETLTDGHATPPSDVDGFRWASNHTEEFLFGSDGDLDELTLNYRVFATLIHTLIFCFGFVGNIVLIVVANKAKTLQTPTYSYLVSLAYADLLVIVTAVPEAIVFHNIGKQWLLGPAGCSIFIFLNFLGINAGSLSILAFTIERYIAICRPLLAQTLCTQDRTRKVIKLMWLFTILYCSPWFGLTEVRSDELHPETEQCEFRLSKELYIIVFGADLILFYLVPLTVAVVVYWKIGGILYRSIKVFRRDETLSLRTKCSSLESTGSCATTIMGRRNGGGGGGEGEGGGGGGCGGGGLGGGGCGGGSGSGGGAGSKTSHSPLLGLQVPMTTNHSGSYLEQPPVTWSTRSRVQVLRMLMVIVILFAVAWLPFRGLLVYNTFVEEPWLDIWYLFFAKTLIYCNSAMNPFIYNIMSRRFRLAVCQTFCGKPEKPLLQRRKLRRPPPFAWDATHHHHNYQTYHRHQAFTRKANHRNGVAAHQQLNRVASCHKTSRSSSPGPSTARSPILNQELDLFHCHYVAHVDLIGYDAYDDEGPSQCE
ncbi:putative Thyrotropin-releasing hormone receptor [Hypsibius exemplaris]|uniref:Thyrotropin-releasing hormone receptor n=1 Tax=Hypsibius exemplaris TaxID=2072580 RepID=A0A1W0WLT6_HYPEX|nr:putative Thyrotropin-releasing hormone receptor [Hypsibius exemplaris]